MRQRRNAFFDVVNVPSRASDKITIGHLQESCWRIAASRNRRRIPAVWALADLGDDLIDDRLVFEDAQVEIEDAADLAAVLGGDGIAKLA